MTISGPRSEPLVADPGIRPIPEGNGAIERGPMTVAEFPAPVPGPGAGPHGLTTATRTATTATATRPIPTRSRRSLTGTTTTSARGSRGSIGTGAPIVASGRSQG